MISSCVITSIFRRLTAFENVQTAFLTHHRRHYNVLARATSLYRELELKTIFPILSRPIRRWEYLVGKYVGTMVTVVVFVCGFLRLNSPGRRQWYSE